MKAVLLGCLFSLFTTCIAHGGGSDKLTVFALSADDSEGSKRFIRSAKLFNFNHKIIGFGTSRPLNRYNIMKSEMERVCSSEKKKSSILLFVDAENAVLVGAPLEIVDSFKKLDAKIVFSGDSRIWPDEDLGNQYPLTEKNTYPYLCAGAFIGLSDTICELFSNYVVDVEDDQLFFTKLYLDENVRTKYNMKIDSKATIFQSVRGAVKDLEVKYLGSHSFIYNHILQVTPKVLFANGANVELNRLSDYVPDGWSSTAGCQFCLEDRISLDGSKIDDYPTVLLAVFINSPTPFLTNMLLRLVHIDYPFRKIVLAIHNAVPFHAPNVTNFLASSIVAEYQHVEVILSDAYSTEGEIKNQVIDLCDRHKCHYVFFVDSLAQITNPHTLKHLIEQNKPVIAPMFKRVNEVWSNFWGSVSTSGYYSRSKDYMEIVHYNRRGLWNVPCVNNIILFRADHIQKLKNAWFSTMYDPDVAFCAYMRQHGYFMYVDNLNHYGYLVNPDYFNTTHFRPDLWEVNTNRLFWEEMYIDRQYWKVGADKEDGTALKADVYESNCHDVFVFPVFSETFCRHLIETVEHYGKWSRGGTEGHHDERLNGGYESVPTVDIHMNQVDFHQEWLQILKNYISPLAKFAFTGYEPESRANMAFVVRYHPNEQDRLKPHFDTSTWSSIVTLTKAGVDYEGGGTRFVRQNCNVTNAPLGSVVVFPGRLTHWHEGLPVTKGVRYITVTFVDP